MLLVYFGDLGLMGTAIVMDLKVSQLLVLALLNPLQVFKIAAVFELRENLEILGPAGVYAYRTYATTLWPLLVGLLFAWVVLPFTLATWAFNKRGVI